jgi:hypothetical protein
MERLRDAENNRVRMEIERRDEKGNSRKEKRE